MSETHLYKEAYTTNTNKIDQTNTTNLHIPQRQYCIFNNDSEMTEENETQKRRNKTRLPTVNKHRPPSFPLLHTFIFPSTDRNYTKLFSHLLLHQHHDSYDGMIPRIRCIILAFIGRWWAGWWGAPPFKPVFGTFRGWGGQSPLTDYGLEQIQEIRNKNHTHSIHPHSWCPCNDSYINWQVPSCIIM